MARNETVILVPNQWTEITNSDVTKITFVNQSNFKILVTATDGPIPNKNSGMIFASNEGVASVELAILFPGANNPKRVWCLGESTQEVFVSHA